MLYRLLGVAAAYAAAAALPLLAAAAAAAALHIDVAAAVVAAPAAAALRVGVAAAVAAAPALEDEVDLGGGAGRDVAPCLIGMNPWCRAEVLAPAAGCWVGCKFGLIAVAAPAMCAQDFADAIARDREEGATAATGDHRSAVAYFYVAVILLRVSRTHILQGKHTDWKAMQLLCVTTMIRSLRHHANLSLRNACMDICTSA